MIAAGDSGERPASRAAFTPASQKPGWSRMTSVSAWSGAGLPSASEAVLPLTVSGMPLITGAAVSRSSPGSTSNSMPLRRSMSARWVPFEKA